MALKILLKILKPGDLVIVFLLIVISLLPVIIFAWQQAQISGDERIAIISLENEVIDEINLSEHEGVDEFDIVVHDHEKNTIQISDGSIRIKSATCPDQVCVRTGYIDKAGQTIVCLPHQLVIEVQNMGNDPFDDDQIDIIADKSLLGW